MLNLLFSLLIVTSASANEPIGDYFRHLYRTVLQAKAIDLHFEFHLDSKSPLAYATTKGNDWRVVVYGGSFDKTQGDDALKLLICHELGHLFEDATAYSNDFSIEGVADYFAGNDCAKRAFKTRNEFLTAAENLTRYWWKTYSSEKRGPRPSRNQKSSERLIGYDEHYHHEAQCRLDIMTAGYDCQAGHEACRPSCWLW